MTRARASRAERHLRRLSLSSRSGCSSSSPAAPVSFSPPPAANFRTGVACVGRRLLFASTRRSVLDDQRPDAPEGNRGGKNNLARATRVKVRNKEKTKTRYFSVFKTPSVECVFLSLSAPELLTAASHGHSLMRRAHRRQSPRSLPTLAELGRPEDDAQGPDRGIETNNRNAKRAAKKRKGKSFKTDNNDMF